MAVIDNLKAQAVSFKVNDESSRFQNVINGTDDILNGGELLDNTLEYTFKVTGLQNHTISSVVVKSLLLNSDDTYCSSRSITIGLEDYGSIYRGTFKTSDSAKTIVSTEFTQSVLQETNQFDIILAVTTSSKESCYYGLQSIVINLSDIDYAVNILFSGPKTDRTVSSITVQPILVSKKAENVTFSKDPTKDFDNETDSVEGKIYFRKDGIYVDNVQYGITAPATSAKFGVVKLNDKIEITDGIVAPTSVGVAATPQLVLDTIQNITTLIDNGIVSAGNTELYGSVKLSGDSFEIETVTDENGNIISQGIVAPTSVGVAATPQLVYNTLATAKNYTDEQTNYSDDFVRQEDNKLYIKWLEITNG